MKPTQMQAILGVVAREESRADLSRLAHAIAERTRELGPQEARGSSRRSTRGQRRRGKTIPNRDGHVIGDKVRFLDNTTKYLYGLEVEVVGTNKESVIVDVPNEERYRRFAGARGMRCPNTIIEKVEKEVSV